MWNSPPETKFRSGRRRFRHQSRDSLALQGGKECSRLSVFDPGQKQSPIESLTHSLTTGGMGERMTKMRNCALRQRQFN